MSKAIVNMPNGNFFYGECNPETNEKEGTGVFVRANLDMHIGSFKHDKRHGPGIFYFLDGREGTGDWQDDKAQGVHIFTEWTGYKYEDIWDQGNKISSRKI